MNGALLELEPDTEGSIFDNGPAVVHIALNEVDGTHERGLFEILKTQRPARWSLSA